MAKLSKQQWVKHEKAQALIDSNRELSNAEVLQVLQDWNPEATHNVGATGTYFTPMELAEHVAMLARLSEGGRYLDLCAGIGRLTWALHEFHKFDNPEVIARTKYVCVEIDPVFVEVGKRIMPWATWVCGNAFDQDLIESLGVFDVGVSNPPFGKVRNRTGAQEWLNHNGDADLQACEVLSRTCTEGAVVIMPAMSLPWEYERKIVRDKIAGETLYSVRSYKDREYGSEKYSLWKSANPQWELVRTSVDPIWPFSVGVRYDIAELQRVYVPDTGECCSLGHTYSRAELEYV